MNQNEVNWKLILITCSIIVCVIMGVRNCFGLFQSQLAFTITLEQNHFLG